MITLWVSGKTIMEMEINDRRRARIGPNDYRRSRRARRADDVALSVISGVTIVFMGYVLCSM